MLSGEPTEVGGVGVRRSGRASLRDLKLLGRAMRCGWNVPQVARQKAIERMGEVLDDDQAGERSWTAATRALISADAVSLSAIDTALRVRDATEVDARLQAVEAKLDGQRSSESGSEA